MRKIAVLFVLLGCVCFKAQAQWIFGGAIGFGSGPQGQFSVSIAPEAGYSFTDHFTLGGRLSYRSGYNQFGVDPYARWDILKPESPVRILLSAHAPMKFASEYFSYGFYAQPGISVAMGSNVRLECHVGAFGWGSVKSGTYRYSGWEASVNGNNIRVGVVFSI